MKVRKRRGQLETFNPEKVVESVQKVINLEESSEDTIWNIAYQIEKDLENLKNPTTEDIAKSLVYLMKKNGMASEARKYDNYRNKIASDRIKDLEKTVLEITSGQNDEWNKENSNKNARLLTTQRDYIAGAVGKSISANYIIPKDVLGAHGKGAIHVHDTDYLAEEARTNCELINLEDMLQNGTVINGVMIEKPKRFITACTIATQIITGVTSATYGGATITLSHLAPFVDSSRQIHKQRYQGLGLSEEKINELAEKDTLKEVNDGIQTFNYQILSMSSTNGQSPFITVFMYLNEVPEGQLRKDLSLIIEEMLRQRIKGLKNSHGSYVAPAFPKLILCLDSTIMDKNSPYHYLLELPAECTSKRLVPDYISEKVMRELKINARGVGDVYPAMGCLDYNETLLVASKDIPYGHSKAKEVKIGDLFEHIVFQDKSSVYKGTKLKNRAKNIKNKEDREKFLENGYLLYSGSHFNLWATEFKKKYGRKPTRLDFKELTGTSWDRDAVMKARGADLKLVSKWDSYLECKVCDVLVYNGYTQIYSWDKFNKYNFVRNKVFECKDGSRKQVDIFFPYHNIGFEINDFITHDRDSDTAEYLTTNGLRCHEEDYGGYKKGPSYSRDKIQKLEEIGIKVHEIWEDEVRSGEFVDIINSILNTKLIPVSDKAVKIENKVEIDTPSVVCYDLEENGVAKYVKDIDGSFTKIKKIMRNSNITNWLRITTHHKSFILTSDHPLIIESGQIIADELSVGDYILNEDDEREYITNIERIERVDYSYDIETESNTFVFSGVQSHNCRAFLTPDRVFENIANAKNFDPDKGKYYGRFNIGVCTLNLPYIALEARRLSEETSEDMMTVFYERLNYYAELCHKMQRIRAERLMETKAEVAPLLWCHGALARLNPNDTLKRLIVGGYATSSLGYSGLYEAVKVLTGENHYEEGLGHETGIAIMKKLNDFTNKWKEEENIDYSLYGTPMESGTYKFAKACRKEFGEDVFRKLDGHDRFFITNSIHIPVFEDIDAFEKLTIESEYQNLSPGGNIIYIETCDLSKNTEAIIQVMEHIYDNCMYAEINTTVSTCNSCGASNTVEVVGIGEDMHIECTNCGQRDEGNGELSYAIRVCGYISTNSFNAGRAGDIQSRVKHIDNKDWSNDEQIHDN